MWTEDHHSGLGRWQVAHRNADPRLNGWVHGYFGSSSILPAAIRERHLPSAEVPLIINFGAPHRKRHATGADWTSHDASWVVGLHNAWQLSEAVGEREFMIVRLTPLGARLFLGVPMHEIANRTVALTDLNRNLARLIDARVRRVRGWAARFAMMEAIIAEAMAGAVTPAAIRWAWRMLDAADGRLALGALAAKIDCDHRTLIAQFRDVIGLPPKAAARLLRFNRVLRALNGSAGGRPGGKPYIELSEATRGEPTGIRWADLATDCGYFDQAHFIREFRSFAGATPGRFLRQVLDVS